MRAVIYARYSSDNQREASIEDQVRVCRERVEREGWKLAVIYSDAALSGATTLRPGYQTLLEDARNGKFDIVVAEALDRLSRDQEDIAGLFKQLNFAGIKLVTLAEGEVSELHIGLKGTMNALYLKDLAQKTHRGLEGRIRKGRSAGSLAYGYDILREFDANGEPVRGMRKLNTREAEIVRSIFGEYASGRSSRAIAKELNEKGVPGPRGKLWNDYAIHGNRRRGTGILNNELYLGRLVWNRQRFIKDPNSGKRKARLNPKGEWVVTNVPDLRIVDDELWSRVQSRQRTLRIDSREDAKGATLNQRHRSRYLLSGLIKCGLCGANYIMIARDQYGCSTRRTKGTCSNDHVLERNTLERLVLDGLKGKLIAPGLAEEFIKEFNSQIAARTAAGRGERHRTEHELKQVEKKLAAILSAIEQGIVTETTRTRLLELEGEKAALERQLSEPEAVPYPSLHPNLVNLYRRKVAALEEVLNDPGIRLEASEILRSLIDKIVVTPERQHAAPNPNGVQLQEEPPSQISIVLWGELATIIGLAEDTNPIGNTRGFSLVAGARSHLYRTKFRWIPRSRSRVPTKLSV